MLRPGRPAGAAPPAVRSRVLVNSLAMLGSADAEGLVLLWKRAHMSRSAGYRQFALRVFECFRHSTEARRIERAICGPTPAPMTYAVAAPTGADAAPSASAGARHKSPAQLRAIIRETNPLTRNMTRTLCAVLNVSLGWTETASAMRWG